VSPRGAAATPTSRLRNGLKNLLEHIRLPHRPTPSPETSLVSPRTPRAPDLRSGMERMNTHGLQECRQIWLMEIDTLTQLNACLVRAEAAGPEDVPSDDGTSPIRIEIEARKVLLDRMVAQVALVETELARRKAPLMPYTPAIPSATTTNEDQDDDDGACQYCFSAPAIMTFQCCHHQSACRSCASRIVAFNPCCPHCRTPNPTVTSTPSPPLPPAVEPSPGDSADRVSFS